MGMIASYYQYKCDMAGSKSKWVNKLNNMATLVVINRFMISIIPPNNILQIEQNGKECEGTGAIEAFDYENARNDFVTIIEENGKQYVRLQLNLIGIQGVLSPVLMGQQFNAMLKCRNENTFHCRWFQINNTNDIYTGDTK